MSSSRKEWVRIFDIPETCQHKKGFTIYKIISMLYPENCPDAVTKITVWKRYNEFKKLHRELKGKHQSLKLTDKYPALPSHPYFKRFNKDVVRERKEAMLNFLEYIGTIPTLFTSQFFVKFFESSHTPNNLMKGSINAIRADLHLPSEPEYSNFFTINSDDERTISDTDSISTMSSLSPSAIDLLVEPSSRSTTSLIPLNKKVSSDSLTDTTKNCSLDSGSVISTPTPPLSPRGGDYYNQYIIDAAQFITKATELEIDKQYDEAFTAYKQGIDILLANVKDDKDTERRQLVRFKIEKYLLRAEKIYNVYLSPEMKSIQELSKQEELTIPQKPLTELYKFKAIRIIENGILVMHTETQELFFIKVIYKKSTFSNECLILPDNVPYMVRLHNYYNCENAIFLILQYSCGKRLSNYLKMLSNNHLTSATMYSSHEGISDDDESEGSYSELLNDYAASKFNKEEVKKSKETPPAIEIEPNGADVKTIIEEEETPEVKELDNILTKSQQLISSMESTIQFSRENSVNYDDKINDFTRKLSDRSVCDEFEIPQQALKLDDVVKWSAQLLLALEKLHRLGVICCDLNINNLLIDDNGDVVLTYMCSISEDRVFKNNQDICLAPELYTYGSITIGVDWWCYGSILYELLVGMSLKCVHPDGIPSYANLRVPKYVCPEGRSLLKQLLIYDPLRRLGCGANGTEEIKTHPFFSSISWEHLESKCI
ncbi:ribosomal protein S6 kinase-like 1 isoform X2 [Onthophagus taurus]|uniref:ribosomal protein S6 kinase-like 1 isoform X2 n=1 Tax=Onthophagus taurus TaxID=166361 RepID=UPI000C209F7D|nr:ribosomal protein S6 kinase delta-1 isoform X2 [Onthophagus taurus]